MYGSRRRSSAVIACLGVVLSVSVARGQPCIPNLCDTGCCAHVNSNSCKWIIPGGDCNNIADPDLNVEHRMCVMGIALDGDVSDAIAAGATVMVDRAFDLTPTDPGPNGDAEQPRDTGDPNGFNVARSVVLFAPDSDPLDGEDDSFLYIGWDVSDHVDADGFAPVPYDADDNGDACTVAGELAGEVVDFASETYLVELQLCTDLDTYQPEDRNPNNVGNDSDLLVRTRIAPPIFPFLFTFSSAPLVGTPGIIAFPTADGSLQSNECIQREISSCGLSNDVEMVIKHIESQDGIFDVDLTPLQRRFALAELVARLGGSSTGDTGDEEFANVAARTSVPSLDVSKQVRCVESGDTGFGTDAVALPGSLVEFEITIRNTGNEDLDVTVTDVMQAIGEHAGLVTCEPLCETLSAEFTTNGVTFAVDNVNAGDFDLSNLFFTDSCAAPGIGFLGAIRNNESERVGRLDGATLTRDAGTCGFVEGDKLVLRFRARPDVTDDAQFCTSTGFPDCQNAVSVEGSLGIGMPVVASDFADPTPDTDEEMIQGFDDNVATVDLVCREFDFIKEVGFPDDADSFVSDTNGLELPPIAPGNPLGVEFRYSGTNTGEVTEAITISDVQLCDDLDSSGVMLVDCPLCDSNGILTLVVQPGQAYATSCGVRFESQMQLDEFLSRDNGRSDCSADPDIECYRNCASATANAYDLGDICDGADALVADSIATICGAPCTVAVVKEVRCLPDCVPPNDPEAGWVTDPDELEIIAGACVQYRITVTNADTKSVDICELRFTDEMLNSNAFVSGPDNVQVMPPVCPLLPAGFNWDGVPAPCGMPQGQPLQPGDSVTVLFDARLAPDADPDLDPLNLIQVDGASFCNPTPSFFDCWDVSSIGLDIRTCDIEVTKDVTCDDPLNTNAVFEPDLAEAIPGATVGYRVQVCNLGEVSVPRVAIDDTLSCADWYVPNSVIADIDSANVNQCVCPGGNCATIDDLDGITDLTACFAGGIPTNGCLTITFEVRVPADFDSTGTPVDCSNTIAVGAFADECSASTEDPCDEDTDGANIDVRVPDIACEKTVCLDQNNNGNCDDADDLPFATDLQVPCDASFPLRLIYRGAVTNTGETPLTGVELCDDDLVAQAVTAGFMVGPCDLCNDPAPCDGAGDTCTSLVNLDTNASAVATCQMVVPSRMAWEVFAGLDGDNDADCHTNSMRTSASAPPDEFCTAGSDSIVESACDARVCIDPRCEISVMKGVRCIDGCLSPLVVGAARFADAALGDFDGNGIMDLRDFARFTECLSGPERTPDPADAGISATSCLAAFDFDGDKDVDMRDGALFDIARMGPADSLPAAPGATVEFEIKVTNEGGKPICELNFRDELMGDIHLCANLGTTVQVINGNGDPTCTVPADWLDTNGITFTLNLQQDCGVLLEIGDMVLVHFAGEVSDNAAGIVKNHVTVDCAPDDGSGCSAGGTVCGDEAMDDAMIPVQRCDFALTKEVTCDEPRLVNGMVNTSAFYEPKVESLPGATNGFRITVCNTGDAAITTIGIADALDCPGWYVAHSVAADIDGDDVTACLCDDGSCATLDALNSNGVPLPPCHAGGLSAGECLTITFEVIVDADHPALGIMPDCTNEVTVEGFTEICGPTGNPCPRKTADAEIDVQRPDIACAKTVCADVDTDGLCDTGGFASTNSLQLPCAIEFPFELIYEIQVTNTGETPLIDVQACDAHLVADALASGLEVGPCDLCDGACDGTNDDCATGPVLAPSASFSAFCTIRVPDRAAWLAFSVADNDVNSNCYANTAGVSGSADPEVYCTQDVDPNVASSCGAEVCLEPKCDIDIICPPLSKIDCTDPTDPDFTGLPELIHDCDPISTVGFRDVIIPGDCPQNHTIQRTWFARAECDVYADCVQIIDVNDKQPPVIEECPTNAFLDCTDPIPPCNTSGVAVDSCGLVDVDCVETPGPGTCPTTIFRELIATDECGNVTSCGYTITIDDTTPPEIECPTTNAFECIVGSTGLPFVDDDCDPDPDVRFEDDQSGECPLTINRTWTAIDECGNTNSCVQFIEVDDTIPPDLTCPDDLVLDCADPIPPCNTSGVADDSCGEVEVDCIETPASGTCPTTIFRELIATDECGNVSTCGYTITIDDTIPPTIQCPPDVDFECLAGSTGLPIVDDNCDRDPGISFEDSKSGTCPMRTVRTWTVVDDCGNTSGCTQVITVDDRVPPVLTCPSNAFLDCTDTIPPCNTNGVAVDSCGLVHVDCVETRDPGVCPTTIFRELVATDECGNVSTCGYTITIDDDEPPELTCPGDETIACDDPVPPCDVSTVVAMDSCGSVVVTCEDVSTTGTCPAVILRKYTATDDCGNVTTCGQRIFIVDEQPPTIACPPMLELECDEPIPPCDTSGIVAADSCGMVNVDCLGDSSDGDICPTTIIRKYSATDECGNVTTCGQLIVIDDTTPPDITCPPDREIACTDPLPVCDTNGIDAADSCGFVNVDCVGPTVVPGTCPTVLTFEYSATDECDNISTCEQTITIDDNEPPRITCPPDFQVDCEDELLPCTTDGVIAMDSCGAVRVECIGDFPADTTCLPGALGFFSITNSNPVDAAIGESQFVVDVTGDGSSVTFTFRNEGPLQSVITEIYLDDGSLLGIASIGDNPPSVDYVQSASPPDLPGGSSITPPFQVSQGFLAEPSGPPPVSGVGPGESVAIVFNLMAGKTLQHVLDELADGTLRIGIRGQAFASGGSESFINGECPADPCREEITRKYRAIDDCGNVTTCGQLIVIDDTTPPVIECPTNGECVCTSGWRVIDFASDGLIPLPAGFIFDGYFPALGVNVVTDNAVAGHPDLAIIFDSANPTGNDPDLVTPGYHPTNTVPFGNVLIIAQDDIDTSPPDTLVDDPDDEGGRPAGWIDMTFDESFTDAILVICDVDQQEDTGSVEFYLGAALVGSRTIFELGDNSIQTIAFSGAVFNRLRVNLAGSASIPEIRLKPVCVPDCDPIVIDNCDSNAVAVCVDIATIGAAGGSAYEWAWSPGEPQVWFSDAAGDWEAVSGKYNAATQQLDWEMVFSDQITEGIALVLNNGPNPGGVSGVWAMFFLDATNPANPELLVYVYNGRNDRSSWYDADPDTAGSQGGDLIESTLLDSSYVTDLSVTDALGKRTIQFSIDASGIQNHVPLFPNGDGSPWQGTGFDGGIGIWLGAFIGLNTSYTAGRLTQWAHISPNGYFDTGHLETEFSCTPGEILRRCEATDNCGNVSTCSFRVVLEECQSCDCTAAGDTTPPVLTCPPDIIVACGDSTDPGDTGMATATDECDPFPVVWFTDSSPFARDTNITRTWHAVDRCGNESTCEQLITVGGNDNVVVFYETFNGYNYFPDQYPPGDPINAGLPLKLEGASEQWYGGRFEGGGGTIDSDLAVQQAGGDGNNSPVGRMDDDAGLLFKIDTTIFSQATLTFMWRTFDVSSGDEFVMGYYVGEIDFASDSPDGEHDDFVHRFNTDGPSWGSWTQLVRERNNSWQNESFLLPTGEPCVWVAFWIDGDIQDFAKIDDIMVTVDCP